MSLTLREILLSTDPVAVLVELKNKGTLATLEPTLAALEMTIPKGYHHKNNLTHSFQVLQNAIDRETGIPDLILRTAALFHDIGKPATREFGAKGAVTFTNHDTVGAKMIRRILPAHGYSKADIELISRLIALHMRSHTFKTGWSESAVRRMATDAGDSTQLQRLIIIFYSDATTKYDSKKDAIHNSVTQLAEALTQVQAADSRAAQRPALNGREVAALLNMQPGPELGKIMKLLNTDQNIGLGRQEVLELLKTLRAG